MTVLLKATPEAAAHHLSYANNAATSLQLTVYRFQLPAYSFQFPVPNHDSLRLHRLGIFTSCWFALGVVIHGEPTTGSTRAASSTV
ncbi:hypothetical protein VFPPC_17810 [Pochonia chlamydosporia 170]|uniref:Uncharacterized protein n=1 Tax=Pochonia chlamydosporia 170 TaxID=1380566 RepID=A0A219AQD4_METCM|nr:hypothetical protein VFPPC_17810 [Pochonia chlamydosporia 170]OWT42997.1 hypothetical protein VFPPC_17810 [Pochonia chlamydosporia 170]